MLWQVGGTAFRLQGAGSQDDGLPLAASPRSG
jgi:hypothetical protein